MDISQIIGYLLAVVVGILLGLLGSGGSILSVPVLVYILKVEPVLATAYSLFVVGFSALFGGIQKAKHQLVDFKKVFLFGIPTIIAVYLTRLIIVPSIPQIVTLSSNFQIKKSVLIMVVFAIFMILSSFKMIKSNTITIDTNAKPNYFKITIYGVFIGMVSGFVGAGGGFLIIPALVFMLKTPMKMAVGTSLFIVSIQSLIGFLGDIKGGQIIDWELLITFTVCSIIGIIIGNLLSKKVSGDKLKVGFGWFVLCMGIYIMINEIIL
jgi:hypothetical protein